MNASLFHSCTASQANADFILAVAPVSPRCLDERGVANAASQGTIGDPTAKGNTCDTADDSTGCIFTHKLIVNDATPAEIDAAVAGGGVVPLLGSDLADCFSSSWRCRGRQCHCRCCCLHNGSFSGDCNCREGLLRRHSDRHGCAGAMFHPCFLFEVVLMVTNRPLSLSPSLLPTAPPPRPPLPLPLLYVHPFSAPPSLLPTLSLLANSSRPTNPPLSQASPAVTTVAATAGTNLQKFTGALGGITAPTVTAGGRGFLVAGQNDNSALDVKASLQRSCDVQKNQVGASEGGRLLELILWAVRGRCEWE